MTVAEKTGMGGRVNTIMQTCFFAISGVLPREKPSDEIKKSIKKTYGKRGEAVVKQNYAAVDATLANLFEVKVPAEVTSKISAASPMPTDAPDFVRNVLGQIVAFEGDDLPVSAMPVDGTFPPPPPHGKNAILPWRSRSGNPICASNAVNAHSSARMRSSAKKSMILSYWKMLLQPSNRSMPSSRNSRV